MTFNLKAKCKRTVPQVVANIFIILLLFLCVYPLYIMFINSFKTGKEYALNPISLPNIWYYKNYMFAWLEVAPYIFNTVLIAFAVVVGVLVTCSLAAYGFTRYKFKGKEFLFMLILALMMVPGILSLIAQYSLAGALNLIGSRWGVILPTIAGSIPFGVFLLRSFFQNLPGELFEAAEIDGASNLRRYFMIALPLSMPILFTLGLSSLMTAWNDLIWPRLILMNNEELYTISVGLISFTDSFANESLGMGVPLAGYVIVSLPLILVFFFTSKQFISGLTSGAFKM